MEYQIPNNIAKFVKDEIAKEITKAKSLHFPVQITVDRIFALIEIAASKTIPKQVKYDKSDIHREI